jgi:hypothetical protein
MEDTQGKPLDYQQIELPSFPLMEKAKEWAYLSKPFREVIDYMVIFRSHEVVPKQFIYHNGKSVWNLCPFYIPFYASLSPLFNALITVLASFLARPGTGASTTPHLQKLGGCTTTP